MAPTPRPLKGSQKGKKPAPVKVVTITENMDEAAKMEAFKLLKAQALEDEEVRMLKEKADNSISEADARRASVAYNHALFRKVRDLEPKLAPFVERLENAVMKRLEAEKPKE